MAGALNKQGRLLYFYGLGGAPRKQSASEVIEVWTGINLIA